MLRTNTTTGFINCKQS